MEGMYWYESRSIVLLTIPADILAMADGRLMLPCTLA